MPICNEENEELKIIWNSLKTKTYFVDNIDNLNEKIKEYVLNKNEIYFINDFKLFIIQYIDIIKIEDSETHNLFVYSFKKQNNLNIDDAPISLKIK